MILMPLIGAALATGLVSCSTAMPPSPPSSAPAPAKDSALVIPPVDAPLEPGPLGTDPCALFGESERATLGLPAATTNNEVGGPACDLTAESAPPGEFLRIKLSSDLTRVAAQCGSSQSVQCDMWSVEMIAGYPAILANGELESRYGSCKILLGISDTSSILLTDVRSTPADGPDCVRATEAATMVIAALQQR